MLEKIRTFILQVENKNWTVALYLSRREMFALDVHNQQVLEGLKMNVHLRFLDLRCRITYIVVCPFES